ncbi:FAD-binding protein [Loktanella sp. IMCC34160]|uniref:flavin monoamine oxidase family protein n=1 Tax=Loktanella sp. IMCC34160 TaxID=2510646 RepID=UPI00101BB7A0|nr:FAD-dependent oxidoreductase [Loktanella sp. IMCC34160]RYG89991.1 FAD-binding protein [Loktanella sp. IMCC34160]
MHTEVLVTGGGLAGLALADQLAQRGTDFLLVEAQERLGGRIFSKEIAGAKFDLGPAWFWPGQPRMAALVRRFDIPVFEQYSTGDLMFQDQSGAVQRGRGFASMRGSYRLAGGMTTLIDGLSGALDSARVITGARLRVVAHGRAGITATFDRGGSPLTVTADRIVLAIPPRVIIDTVSFAPELPAGALKDLYDIPTWMAGQAKILAVYDEPHWRKAGLSGDAMSHHGPLVEIHDASPMQGGPYALFGFVGVPPDVREAHRDQITHTALAQLVTLFGSKMANPRAIVLQDWATLPEIAGLQDKVAACHHPNYGSQGTITALSAKGVYFGSTETAIGFGGYLEGALEAAEGIARQSSLTTAE